jgi:hypothetical protein
MTMHPLLLYVYDFSFSHPFETEISHHSLSGKNSSVNHKQPLHNTRNKLKILYKNFLLDFAEYFSALLYFAANAVVHLWDQRIARAELAPFPANRRT